MRNPRPEEVSLRWKASSSSKRSSSPARSTAKKYPHAFQGRVVIEIDLEFDEEGDRLTKLVRYFNMDLQDSHKEIYKARVQIVKDLEEVARKDLEYPDTVEAEDEAKVSLKVGSKPSLLISASFTFRFEEPLSPEQVLLMRSKGYRWFI